MAARSGTVSGGVYAFYDCDGEPIYVGQTKERLRNRIRRHLTNQSTDAVAMSVLDPFEVAEIEMWPFWRRPSKERLNQAECTVYGQALVRCGASSRLGGASWGSLPCPWWNIQYHRAKPLRSHHRRPSLGPCHGGSASRCLSVPPPCGIGSDWN